jgi:hypothetical protein
MVWLMTVALRGTRPSLATPFLRDGKARRNPVSCALGGYPSGTLDADADADFRNSGLPELRRTL